MTGCVLCGRPIPLLTARPGCTCGGLPAIPDPAPFDPRGSTERRIVGAARFGTALGLLPPARPPLTLGEAGALVEPLAIDGAPPGSLLLRADMEPSGSAADAGAALLASSLSGAGHRVLYVDDAFDHALALARFVDGGRLRVTARLGRNASLGRRALLERNGVRVVEREPAGDDWIDAHPARQPLAALGGAAHAFRVVEVMGCMPGSVVAPVAHGTLLAGLAAGFASMVRAGVGPMPRMYGVQSIRCAPLADAFARGDGQADDRYAAPAGAGRLTLESDRSAPERDIESLDAALGSGGSIEKIDDAALERAVRLLWRAGIKIEPWAALPVAWSISPGGRERLAGPGPAVIVLAGCGVRGGSPYSTASPDTCA